MHLCKDGGRDGVSASHEQRNVESKMVCRRLWGCLFLLGTTGQGAAAAARWSEAQAREWQGQQPWLVGCNFVPSTAVNDTEMWQAESFDLKTIERELATRTRSPSSASPEAPEPAAKLWPRPSVDSALHILSQVVNPGC